MSQASDNQAPLSVIIPTRNAQESLPAALRALKEGALPGLIREVLVADGGSGDSAHEKLELNVPQTVYAKSAAGQLYRLQIEAAEADRVSLNTRVFVGP